MPKHHQARAAFLLVVIMGSFYLLSYRASIQSGDTLRALDTLTSLSRFNSWHLDESTWFKPPHTIRDRFPLPIHIYDVEENLNLRLALPLLKLAESVPRLGNIHTVWLFNVIIAALTAGLIYLTVRAFDYGDWAALAVAAAAGLATSLWAYSQTFLREPLAGFFILLALFCIQSGRRRGRRGQIIGSGAGAAALFLAYATKSSAVIAAPALLVFALPALKQFKSRQARQISQALLIVQVLLFLLLMLFDPLSGALFPGRATNIAYVLRAYVLSPGGSLWGTSPILLLAVFGCLHLLRAGRQRLVWTLWLLFAGYTLGHALSTGAHWFGGLSWPPRFLVPILPALMLATAPIAQAIVHAGHPRRRLLAALWLGMLAYGMWIQFSSVSLSWWHYGDTLPPQAGGLSEWEPGLYDPQYFRWVILPRRWADLGLDFVWARAALPGWALSFALYGALLTALLLHILRRPHTRWRRLAPLAGLLGLPLLLINLSAVYDRDPLTQSQQPGLQALIDFFDESSQPGDILVLSSNRYQNFILNHLDRSAPRPIILPEALAEAPSDKQPAQIQSSNPNDWLQQPSLRAIHHLATHHDRFWLLTSSSPFMDWSFRAFERYLALHYYPLPAVALTPPDATVRLLEYSTRSPAPHPFAAFAGDTPTDLQYGADIHLRAFALPNGLSYAGGESIELSLQWQAARPLEQDYTVAFFVVDAASGQPIAQGQDSAPQAGFAPTSSWQPRQPVWDNRALRLPAEIDSGDYHIWVLLYHYDAAAGRIERLPVSGANTAEGGTVGILPAVLKLE